MIFVICTPRLIFTLNLWSEKRKEINVARLLLWLLLCFFEIIIIVLLFSVVFFMQVHLYAYTHFYFEPPVRKKMTGTGHSKAHP